MEQGVIFKIQRYCVSDGPRIRTVVFLKGCLKEYKDCDAADIAERYIEGQPQPSFCGCMAEIIRFQNIFLSQRHRLYAR